MKLRRFWIGSFRNLRDVTIAFDRSAVIDYGAGKSNALEALGLVFSHLAAGADPGFEYLLDYELDGRAIRIDARAEAAVRPIGATILVRERPDAALEPVGWSSTSDLFLPDRVVGFSTGPTSGLVGVHRLAARRAAGRLHGRRPADLGRARRLTSPAVPYDNSRTGSWIHKWERSGGWERLTTR